MRKIISTIIAIVFAVSLTACGTVHRSATNPVPSTSHSKVSKPRKVSKPQVRTEQSEQTVQAEPELQPPTDYNALAARVIAGEFGDGEARRAALGADYEQVQSIVNELMSQPVQSTPVQQPAQSDPQTTSQPVVQTVEQSTAPVEVAQPESSEVAQPVEPADAPDDVVAEFSANPSQSWDDWRTEFGSDADVDVPLSQVPVCAALDGSTGTGYEKVCQATSSDGLHYVLVGGTAMEVWR